MDEGINVQDSYGPLEVHKQKVECAFEWYPLGSTEKYQITLDKWIQFSHSPHSSHLISLLCPLNNKFPNPNTKKIYNKFPNQLRKKKKKKSIPCIGVTDDVLREKGKKRKEKKKRGRITEGELCESVECSGKNKDQKRVKEKKKEGKKRKE